MENKFGLLVGSAAVLFSTTALAQNCYKFEMPESVEMSSIPTLKTEVWCYEQLSSPAGATLIFNADSAQPKPELSAVVEADGMVTHASLVKGKVTTHKVNSADLNPLPVPLKEPIDRYPLPPQAVGLEAVSFTEVLNFLQTSSFESQELRVEEGEFVSSVPQVNLPWRGFWWSYKSNALAGSTNSPLAKYDRYVQARTGTMPRVASWERTYHKYKDISWEGHCNGWAASAVLRAEPNTSRIHPQSGIVFTVADQKGILAEEDYCAVVAFHGKRNYGKASNDPKDIYPDEFHKVLTYYIAQLGKVVAVDYFASRTVDNHLISGYNMKIVRTSPTSFQVLANLQVHKYDSSKNYPPGVAPTYMRTYKYNLRTDEAGNIVSGTWLSANPDFLWVPLSPTDCSSNNPRMAAQYVNEIISLPPISNISAQ